MFARRCCSTKTDEFSSVFGSGGAYRGKLLMLVISAAPRKAMTEPRSWPGRRHGAALRMVATGQRHRARAVQAAGGPACRGTLYVRLASGRSATHRRYRLPTATVACSTISVKRPGQRELMKRLLIWPSVRVISMRSALFRTPMVFLRSCSIRAPVGAAVHHCACSGYWRQTHLPLPPLASWRYDPVPDSRIFS